MTRRDLYLEYRARQIPAAIAWDFAKRGLPCDRQNLARARREDVRIAASNFVRAAEYAADVRLCRVSRSMQVQMHIHGARQNYIERLTLKHVASELGVHPDLLR